jgi:hypothetical protein
MEERRPNFRLIKERVSMLDVLARYSIELRGCNQYQRFGKCPLPQHTSKEANTFYIDRVRGTWVWSCHSGSCVAARNLRNAWKGGLKKGGDLIEFVKFMEGLPGLYEAGRLLEEWFGPFADTTEVDEQKPAQMDAQQVDETPARNKPLAFTLKGIDPTHEYLAKRGFEEEECRYLDVGFYGGKGSMSGRVVFPIHDENGELVAYAGRSIDPSVPPSEWGPFPGWIS